MQITNAETARAWAESWVTAAQTGLPQWVGHAGNAARFTRAAADHRQIAAQLRNLRPAEADDHLAAADVLAEYAAAAWELEADAAERLRASIAADPRPLHGPAHWPGSIAITRDPSSPDGWRMTYFDPAGEPAGHFGPAPFARVVDEARFHADIRDLRPITAEDCLGGQTTGGLSAPADVSRQVNAALRPLGSRRRG